MNWTAEQARAIELRNKNILVAAAAGSGKTAVLVERIKKLILEGECSIDRMLIVTFTNAAAAEMKEKIERAIEKEAEGNPGQIKLLKQQLERMPLANISTFHAFALEVIRRFFYLINIEPNFKICDNVRQELLKEQALDELLKLYFEEENPEFFAFLNKYSGDRSELRFRQTVRKTFEIIQSLPEPFEWFEGAVKELDSDFGTFSSGKICRFIKEDTENRLRQGAAAINSFAEKILWEAQNGAEHGDSGDEAHFHEGVAEITAAYTNLAAELVDKAESGDFDGIGEKLEGVKMPSLLKKYFKPDDFHTEEELAELKEQLEVARTPLKEAVSSLKKDYYYDSLENLHDEIRKTYPDAEFFLKTVKDYRDIFARLKKEQGLVDFSDIEHYAFEILKDEEAAAYYREKFTYIFIDEYQDSNLLQEALVARIKRENNLFMVGDVKQSIYKFRLAEPEIFQARYRDFAEEQKHSEERGEESLSEKIDLNRNFRSKKTVIDFINRVFKDTMTGYDENAALHMGDVFGERCNFQPKLYLAETPWDEDSELDDELKNMIKAEKEALAAVKIIGDSLGKTIFDSKLGTERPLKKGDIVILMRGIKNYGDIFYKILTDNNLPAYVDDNDGYFDTLEINVFLSLLDIIDNEKQDIPLLTVMRSEIFGFTIEELARIRIACREKCSYHDAVLRYAESGEGCECDRDGLDGACDACGACGACDACGALPDGEDEDEAVKELRKKCAEMFKKLEEWRLEARLVPLEELVWNLMLETGFYIAMGAMPSGSRRQANLRALCDKALAYRKSQGGSLYGFIQYIEAVKQRKVSMGQVKMAAEGDDTIRIMTIHKSKGLEFPMVLLAGFCRRLNYTKSGKDISVHKDIGVGFPLVNYEESWMKTSLIQNVIRVKMRREEVEEEKRILYVAMTRAKDILYILGITDNYNNDVEKIAKEAPSDSSYFTMCGGCIYREPSARGHISNGDLKELSEGRRRNTARALALLDAPATELGAGSEESPAIGEVGVAAESSVAEEMRTAEKSPICDKRLSKDVEHRMNFEYPFAADLKTKSKYSVSELAGKHRAEISLSEPKSFKAHSAFTAAQIGTLTHKVLEKIDFASFRFASQAAGFRASAEELAQTAKYVESLIYDMVKDEFLTEAEAEAIDREKIAEFIVSPLGRRMAAAGAAAAAYESAAGGSSDFLGLQRERPFNLVYDAAPAPLAENTAAEGGSETEARNLCGGYHSGGGRQDGTSSTADNWAGRDTNKSTGSIAGSGDEKGARSIVQGIIDCFFEEEGELVLVDYKTTNVRSKGEFAGRRESIRERYALQIDLYRRALEAATGKRVKEAYLYLTNIGETIEM